METEAKTKTFRELYNGVKNVSPKADWIRRIAKVTMRTDNAVRMWINGRQVPDALTQSIIAKELGVPIEGLFPAKTRKK